MQNIIRNNISLSVICFKAGIKAADVYRSVSKGASSTTTPFGEVSNQVESITQPFKFNGKYGVMYEPNGLCYMRARYYDPHIQRFISEDPSGFNGGDPNLNAYCGNNPINFADPFGLCAEGNNSWTNNVLGGIGIAIVGLTADDVTGIGVLSLIYRLRSVSLSFTFM